MPEAPSVKSAKLRIAVIGPDAQQGSHIKSKCQGRASVGIVDRSQKGKKFPDVDYVIITRHADHNWYEAAHAAMKQKGRDRVIRLAGTGVDSVVGVIEDLLKPKDNGVPAPK